MVDENNTPAEENEGSALDAPAQEPVTPAPTPTGALNYNQLRDLYPAVKKANNRSRVYRGAKKGELEGLIRQDFVAAGATLSSHEEAILREAQATRNYRTVEQLFPSEMIDLRFGEQTSAYTNSLALYPGAALEDAPERVIMNIVLGISKPMIENVSGYEEFAREHLKIKGMEKTLQDTKSDDDEKRIVAKKKICDAFKAKNGLDGNSKESEMHLNIAYALGLEITEYQDLMKTNAKEFSARASASVPGREYLAAVGGDIIEDIIQKDYAGQVQEI